MRNIDTLHAMKLIRRGVSLLCIVALHLESSQSSTILMLPYSGEGSHYLSMARVGERLVSNGHDVTFLISDVFDFRVSHPGQSSMFKFELFPHHLGRDRWQERTKSQNDRLLSGQAVYHAIVAFEDIVRNFSMDCEDILRNVALRERLVDAAFEFAVVDPTTPCGVIVAQMLHLPHGLFIPISGVPTLTRALSAPAGPAYVSSWQSGHSHRMSFPERLVNTLMDVGWVFFFQVALFSYHDALREKYDVRNDVDSKSGMSEAHFSLSFADWTLEYPRPFVPNVIGSAGLNIAAENELLDQKWATFMETDGKDGVVIVSFGTLLHWIPEKVTNKLVDAFSQLPYTVVWQMSKQTQISNLSSNIILFEWIPIPGLLAHSNTVLFVNHAGINSLYEAIYYSKPVLMFPLFGDQPDSARRFADRKCGLQLHMYNAGAQEIVDAILELTAERRYKEHLTHLTSMYREQPNQAREILPFVIEQAVRSKSLLLQRCRGQEMGLIQYYLLDVFCAIAILTVLAFISVKKIVTFTVGCL